MKKWKKIPLLILALTLVLSLAACSTIQSVVGSIGSKQDPSTAGNKPAGNHFQEEDPSVAGNKPTGDHSGDTDPGQGGQDATAPVNWTLNGGVLTISGNGEMKDIPGGGGNRWDPVGWPWLSDRESITSVVIEPGVTSIGSEAFKGCTNLSSVTIPDGVTWIGINAFWDCDSLASVTIPDSVTGTLTYTFVRCHNLTEVTVGSGVEVLDNAFVNCPALVTITIRGSSTQGEGLLTCSDPDLRKKLIQNCTIYAPAGSPIEEACKIEGFNFSPLN